MPVPGVTVPEVGASASRRSPRLASATRAVTEILAARGMLDEDRESALDTWFIRRAADLPELMAAEFRIWFDALRDGSLTPRPRPRGAATIRVHVARAAPMLHGLAGRAGQSLREVTRQDLARAPCPPGPRSIARPCPRCSRFSGC